MKSLQAVVRRSTMASYEICRIVVFCRRTTVHFCVVRQNTTAHRTNFGRRTKFRRTSHRTRTIACGYFVRRTNVFYTRMMTFV
jgi:hypothetical protein